MNGFMNHRNGFTELAGRKIVVLIGAFMRGGCERQAFLLAKYLRAHEGIDAQVWSLKFDGPYREEFEAAGIPTKVLHWGRPHFGWVQRTLPVVRQLREAGVDILLPFTTWPNVVAGLAHRFSGVRLCVWGERHCGGERVPGVERFAVRQYRRFAANSTAGVEFLAREMHVDRDRISFIPNGVEEPKIGGNNRWRERLGMSAEQLLVVKVANVTLFKDHATLLRAWKIVQDEWSIDERPILALAGLEGDAYPECQRIVKEFGLHSTVRFLGSIPDVPDLLQACDLTVFSSPNEGMPNGVMECMAHGKAIVASDLPGIRDLMGTMPEFLYPSGNADRCARKILELLRSRDRRLAIGAANRARMISEFSVERMAQRHLHFIQQNLPKARRTLWRGFRLLRPHTPGQTPQSRQAMVANQEVLQRPEREFTE